MDYLNYSVPVPNPDENGNNQVVAVRAGKPSSFSKPITMYAPINMNGLFLYNVLGDGSLSYYSYGNNTPTVASAVWVQAVPNGGVFVQETLASTGTYMDTLVLNGATAGTFRMNRGAVSLLSFWIEFQVVSVTANGTGNADLVRLAVCEDDTAANVVNPARPAPAQPTAAGDQSPDFQVDPYGTPDALLTTRVWRGINQTAIADVHFVCIKIRNMTSAARPVLIKNIKIILSTSFPPPV